MRELIIDLQNDKLDIVLEKNNDKSDIEIEENVERITSDDYNKLKNKPSIEGVTLQDDKTFEELGLSEVSNLMIDELFKNYFNI